MLQIVNMRFLGQMSLEIYFSLATCHTSLFVSDVAQVPGCW